MRNQYSNYPIEALVEVTEELRGAFFYQYSIHLCRELEVHPEGLGLGEKLHRRPKENNLQTAKRWLKVYLGDQDILGNNIHMGDCTSEFRRDVSNRVPTHLWGGSA